MKEFGIVSMSRKLCVINWNKQGACIALITYINASKGAKLPPFLIGGLVLEKNK